MKLNLLTKSIINFTESLNTFFRIIMLTSDCKGFNFFQLLLDRPFLLFCFSHLKSLFISFQCYDWLGSSMYVSVPDRFCYDKTWIILVFVLIFSFQIGLTDRLNVLLMLSNITFGLISLKGFFSTDLKRLYLKWTQAETFERCSDFWFRKSLFNATLLNEPKNNSNGNNYLALVLPILNAFFHILKASLRN